jgi:hypothetical protein
MSTTQEDRAMALLVLASDGRMMRAEPRDVVALVDFLEEPEVVGE